MRYKSIMQDDTDECFYCGSREWLEWHHIFNKCDKTRSEKYGMMVRLCNRHHTQSPTGVHHNQALWNKLKADAQIKFEQTYDESFLKVFGRSYV